MKFYKILGARRIDQVINFTNYDSIMICLISIKIMFRIQKDLFFNFSYCNEMFLQRKIHIHV